MKRFTAVILCTTMALSLFLSGCGKANVDTTQTENLSTEATSVIPQAGDNDYDIIKEYSPYFTDKKISTENITLTKAVADKHCESFHVRGAKSAYYETIEDVKNNLGIEYLRHSAEITTGFDYVYSIHPTNDDKNNIWYLIYVYNKNGYVIDSFCIDKILKSWTFSENLKAGKSTFDDVLKIDNHAKITEEDNYTYESKHRCSQGIDVYIIYKKVDDKYIVSDIEYETDPVRFTQNIKPIDYDVLQQK